MEDLDIALQDAKPEPGEIALFRLEQSHFIMKPPRGFFIHVDPFLSREVKPENHLLEKALIQPELAPANFVFLTHNHRDHTDPLTLGPLAGQNPGCLFVGPPESIATCREVGASSSNVVTMRIGDTQKFPGFSVTATYGYDTDEPPVQMHQGYVFDFNGLRIFHLGDTHCNLDMYLDKMQALQGMRPDVLIVPINRGHNNPGPETAKRIAEMVLPGMIIPCHYDCFKNNQIDPQEFLDILTPEMRNMTRIMDPGDEMLVRAGQPA